MNWKKYTKVSSITILVFVLLSLTSSRQLVPTVFSQLSGTPSSLFKYDILAQTDHTDLTELSAPSINNLGVVAFVGKQDSGAENIFVAENTINAPRSITSFTQSTRFVFPAQISDSGQVVARDGLLEAGVRSNLRIWNADTSDDDQIVAQSPANFDLFVGNSSINSDGSVANNDSRFQAGRMK